MSLGISKKKQGGFFKVYTPFWNALKTKDVTQLIDIPKKFCNTGIWPDSEKLSDWNMANAMYGSTSILKKYVVVGEKAAKKRLEC